VSRAGDGDDGESMTQESEPQPRSSHLGLEVAPTDQRARPGERAVFQINIANRTDEAQSQSLELRGLPGDWFSVDFDEKRVAFPQEQRSASLIVSAPEGTEPGRQPFRVVVRAGDEEAVVQCSLEVLAPPEAPAAPPPQKERPPAPVVSLSQALVTWEGDPADVERLTVTVRNEGSTDTDYALSLEGLSEGWYTLTPTLRVRAGAAMNTELRIHPPAGTDPGDYPFAVHVAIDEHPDVVAEAQGRISVTLPAPEPPPPQPPAGQAKTPTGPAAAPPDASLAPRTTFDFGPGELAANAILTVQNKSDVVEQYEIQVMGIPDNWYSLQATDLRLEPGARQEVLLRLTPHTGPGLPAGLYDFRIRVAPHRSPDSFRDVGGRMGIAGVVAFDGRLSPVTARGRKEKFNLTLVNKGSIPLDLEIEGSDLEGMCRFDVPPLPALEQSEERAVPVQVGARRNRFLGPPETFDFRLEVTASGDEESATSKTFRAQLVHTPLLSYRFAFLCAFIASLIAIVTLILTIGISPIDAGFDATGCALRSEYKRWPKGNNYVEEECKDKKSEYVQCQEMDDPYCEKARGAPPVTPTPTATAEPAETAVPADCQPAEGITIGAAVEIAATQRIRQDPGLGMEILRRLDEPAPATVLDGHRCVDDHVWWRVELDDGLEGWAAEGEDLLKLR
jgi:uncharacterized membrane protein